jgi:putative FmdB family regulatory protein
MPVYEYSCLKCGYRFEKLQKNSSTNESDCPSCGSKEVKRELSTFSSVGSTSSSAGCFSGGG